MRMGYNSKDVYFNSNFPNFSGFMFGNALGVPNYLLWNFEFWLI